MLVLSRKRNEEIKIGDDVTVKLLKIAGDKATIGIEAPPDVVVLRREVYERLLAQAAAASLTPDP